jgi:type VI secretion system protein ImpA
MDGLVGPGKAKDFGPLTAALSEIRKTLAPYAPQGPLAADAAAGEEAGASAAAEVSSGPRGSISETVESRPQVIQALQLICDYYARYEPSSPVPLLLERAKRLVEQDFLGVVAELSPETLEKVRAAMGVAKKGND